VLLLVIAAAFTAAGTATGDPSVSAKRAQAQQILGQIQQLDASMQRARNAYDSASAELGAIEHDLTINKIGLRAARANLGRSQVTLERRLVAIYTTRDDQSTLAVLLGVVAAVLVGRSRAAARKHAEEEAARRSRRKAAPAPAQESAPVAAIAPSAPAVAPAPFKPPGTICPVCGSEFGPESKFCGKDGATLLPMN